MKLKNQIIEGKEFILENSVINQLGPELTLKHCTILSKARAKSLSLTGLTIIEGTFESKVPLSNFHWHKVNLKGVKFLGRFSGCDFGQKRQSHGEFGGIEFCDFSSAKLNYCRFMNCDTKTIIFPKWPHFTIASPRAQSDLIKAISWPGSMNFVMNLVSNSSEGCMAFTANACELTDKYGGTEEELKLALTQLKDVIY